MEKLSLGKDNIDGSIATLKAGDFSGLVNLPKLGFWNNELSALPATVFSGLANLMNLGLRDNRLSALPTDVFSGLSNLRKLVLGGNQLTALPTTIFSGLTNLQELDLGTNQLTTLPPGVFSGLDNLGGLFLAENRLTTLPPGTFSGLSSLRALQLENSPGAPFSLKLRLEPADETKELADLLSANTPAMAKFTLREGAPYPLTFALTASGVQLSTDQVTIPTGNTQSVAFTMTRNAGENQVRITLSEPSSPPTDCNDDWRSGTGDCYTGFEIVHDRTGPRATTIRFTSTPQNPNGYVGRERIRVDVVFDRGLVIDPPITLGSASSPTLVLQIGADRRTATCVAESNVLAGILSFVYTVGAGDFDRNGVSVAQNGLQLNGSTITDVFNNPATVELEGGLLADFPEQKVGRDLPLISFTDGDNRIWGDEGGTAEAAFSLNPAPAMPTTVYYAFDHDTADADDYVAGSGEIVVPADATEGTIEIPIMDDDDIEPVRERFYVNLVDSADYVLGSRTRLEVFIAEGVCDRTPQVRDRIRGSSSCRDISTGTINGIGRLVLSARGIEELKEKDFLQLTMLEDLYLRDNELTSLPEGVFAGLGDLEILTLHGNELTTLPEGVFAGLGSLEILSLNGNELTTLPEGVFAGLGSLGLLTLYRNRLTTLPPGAFLGLSSLRSLRLHDNPGSTFRLTLGLEPVGEAANVNLKRLTRLLSTSEPATVKLTLREGAPYPLTLALTASGVQLSTDQVMIPAGSTRSVAFTMTRNMDRARIDFSEPPSPPDDCPTGGDWNHEGPCFSGFEIVGAPTIYFVYDGMAPQVTTIQFTSTPQDPEGYIEGEAIKVDVVFDRGLVTSPITEGSSSSPTLALQIGNNQRTATYVVGSNAAGGVLSFVYTVGAGDLDENGVSVAQDGLQLNGATVTEPVGDRPANVALEAGLLADFPEQKVRRLPLISFEDNEIEPAEGETVNAVFNFNDALTMLTTIHYTVDPDSADASDYEAGSGEIAVPADATSGTIQIFIVDDDIIEPARETFSLNLVDSDGYALGSPTRIEVRIREGVCDRTGPVRIAIENAIGANHCSDVSSVPKSPRISLTRWDTVTAYKRDDFTDENLNKLPFRSVEISGHSRLTTLPAGLFGNLLEHLLLQDNALATLPEELFAGLVNLQRLRLDDNDLTTLPEGVFDDLGSLTELWLNDNDLTTLPENLFAGLVNLQWLRLNNNDLTTLPEGTFSGLSSLSSLWLHDNPGAPFRLELGLEPADETANVNLRRLARLLSPLEPAMVKLTLREGAPYPLALALTASGVELSADQVMIPAGSTQSVAFTAKRIAGESRVRIALSEPPPPSDCEDDQKHEEQCFTGIEIVGGPTINFVYDGMAPQVTMIRLTSTPQDPNGYRQGETIKVDVVFDRGLVISPIMEGSSPSPTLALQIGADRRTATYVVESNAGDGVLSFVYTVTAEDFDENGVSVVQDGLESNGVTLTEPVGDRPANVALENRFLADFPGHKVFGDLPSVSLEESEIEPAEGETINVVFNLDVAVTRPTAVRYALTPGTANINDYLAGNGEVVVPASETSGTIQIRIVNDAHIEHARDTFSLNLVNSNDYALGSPTRIEISIREGVCDRTPQVAEAIRQLGGQSHCSDVSDPSVITRLSIVDAPSLTTLKERDFFELDGLQRLDLNNNGLTALPEGVFDGLGSLTELRLNDNELTTLTAGTFAGLPALRTLLLQNNRVSTLSASIFNGLSNLQTIDLGSNGIMQLPDDIFADNNGLQRLFLGGNSLTALPAGVFAGLGRLTELRLNNNGLTTLPAGIFARLSALRTLQFQNNQVATWTASIFNGLSNLQTIDFGSNGITQLPDDIFADNGNLQNLLLGGNQLRELPEQVFFGLTQLRRLAVNGNRLTEVPAGAFPGYAFLGDLRLYDNRLESLPPGVFSDLERASRLGFHNNRLTALPPGAFSGVPSNLGALTLGANPGSPFQLKLRLEFAGEEQAPTLTDEPVILRATLREGAPYALAIELQAFSGTLSSTEVTIEAGSTRSGTFTVTRLQGENSVATSFADVSPPTPPNRCPSWQRYRGQCFAGFEIVSDAEFVLDDQPLSAVSDVAITSAPVSGDTYVGGDPNEEIVVEIEFSGEIDVIQANDGSRPALALEVGDETRFAAYDDAASSTDKMVFRYKPQDDDHDDDGISVLREALRLNGARILDAGVPVSLDLGAHAIRNAPNHKVEVRALSFEESDIRPAEGETVNAVFNFSVAVVMPTTVRYSLAPGTANADDYEAGSGEVLVPAGESSGTIRIPIVDDNIVERARDTFSLNLVDSDGYVLGSQTEIGVFIKEGVCDRTPQVAEAIIGILNRAHCSDVNNPRFIRQLEIADNPGLTTLKRGEFFELDRLERLYLSNNGLTTLPEDVFDDIRNTLQRLRLDGNDLTTLPEGVFDGLGRLTELRLDDNDLTTLPEGVFDNLGSVLRLALNDNDLTTLTESVFDALGSLTELRLDGNDLTTLPEGAFDDLGSVLRLALNDNRLTTLTEGTFTGLSSLRSLQLHDNPGTTFRLTLGLEAANEAANVNPERPADLLSANTPATVKLTLREGAPYRLTLALTASGVQLSTNSVTIHTGSTQSETITMTRNAGENQVRITFPEPPSPPNDCPNEEKHEEQCFTGFEIVYAGIEISIIENVCNRTPQIRDGIVGLISGVSNCADVTDDHLSEVTGVLDLSSTGINTLSAGDFSGLDGLNGLDLSSNQLTTLPPDAFSGLGNLKTLYLGNNRLAGVSLPSTIFSALANLETLDLSNNRLDDLPIDAFSGLSNLETLSLSNNRLDDLPADVFSDLGSLEALYLGNNRLAGVSLSGTIFSALAKLETLDLSNNQLVASSLPTDVFSALAKLERLDLSSNQLSSLPLNVFSGLVELEAVWLSSNVLTTLPNDVFSGLRNLRSLYLNQNQLASLPPGVFSGLVNLEELWLNANELSALPATVFSGLDRLRWLSLDQNELGALPATVFSGLDNLRWLFLGHNRLSTLPPTIFSGADDSGLPNLERLYLGGNQLSALTATVFSSLGSLRELSLRSNQLSALPATVFSGLDRLGVLWLSSNVLTVLPDDVFSGLSGLEQLYLFGNQLSALPDGVFSGLDNLRWLDLHSNGLSTLPANTFSGLLKLNVLNLADNPGAPFVFARSRLVYVGRTDPPMPRTGTFKLVLDQVAPAMITVPLSAEGGELSGGLSGGETVISAGNTESDPFTVTQTSGASVVTLRASTGTLTGYYSGVETAASELVVDLIGPSVSGVTIISRPSLGDAYQASSGEEIRVAITFDQAVSVSNAPTLTLTIGETTRAATYDPDSLEVSTLSKVSTLVFTYVLQAGDVDEDGISVESDALMLDGAAITLMSPPLTPLQITSLGSYEILNAAGHRVIPNSGLSFDVSDGLILEIEEGGTIDLTVTLSSPTNAPVAVGYEITADADPGTADADASDYSVPSPGSVTIEAGETTAALSVPINDDDEAEPARESFVVSLMPVAGYDPVFPATVLVVIKEGVCDRTPQIENSILERIGDPGNPGDPGNCADASDDDLSEIRTLTSTGITTAISPGDFSGLDNLETLWLRSGESLVLQDDVFSDLVNLRRLDLHQSGLTALPAGVFSGLGSLEELWLSSNRLTVLPPDVFSGLANLRRLFLGHNGLTALPPTVFSGLPNLERLHLDSNQLSTLPDGVFSSLGNLRELSLGSNLLSTLSAPMFSGLGNLEALYLWGNQLASLPDRVFESLGNLEKLELSNNRLGTLPGNVFSGLGNLKNLYLSGNDLSSLSGFTFFPLTNLERLYLFDNQLTSIQGTVFSRLSNLQELNLNGNQLANLQGLEFSGLGNLQVLHLSGNQLVTLPANIFSPVTGLQELHLIGNQLTTLPEGIFSGLVSNLRKLRLHDNPGAPFVFVRPELVRVAESNLPPGVVEVKLVVDETLPTTITAALSMDGGTLSATEAVIPGGSTESATFTVTQTTAAPATLTASAGTLAGRLHYTGVVTAPSELVLDSIVPSISFEESEIEAAEGETANAVFNFNVVVGMQTIVRYTLEPDTADANDYMASNGAGSGEVVVPPGATEGTIEIPIVDDADIEPVRERFYVNLVDSAGYTLGNRTRLEVLIAEGSCDRTQQIRDRLSRGLGSCRDVDIDTLNRLDGLTLSARGIQRLKEKDFLQLENLEKLYLRDNVLTTLPKRVFAGFSALEILTLHGNELTTLPPGVFADLGSLEILALYGNQLTTLPEGTFSGLSSLKALQLHDNPGTTFRLTLGLEAADETPDVNLTRLTSLLSANTPAMVKLTLREGAPYPLALALTASGVQLSADSVTIPAGSTQSVAFTMTRNMDRVRVDFSAPPSPPNDCPEEEKRQGQCFTGFEIVGAPTIYFVYDGGAPQVTAIRFTSTPQDPEGYVEGEVIKVDVVFDRGLVVSPITRGSPPPTLALQIGNNQRTATYVVGSNAAAGILSFVYVVRVGDFDENGVSVARDGLRLNGASVTDVFNNPASTGVDDFLADFPEQKVRTALSISFEDSEIEPAEGETVNAVFNFSVPAAMPTIVRYTIEHGTADAGDYEVGSGEVVVPADATSGTIRIFIVDDELIERTSETFSLNLVDSDDYALGSPTRIEISIREGVCDRTSQVRDGIVAAIDDVSDCAEVTDDHLSGITERLALSNVGIATLKAGDFSGLANLERLHLNNNHLTTLPATVFSGLGNLATLWLDRNQLSTLPATVFSGLGNLTTLDLRSNQLSALPSGVFSDLGNLLNLWLSGNQLSALPAGVFSDLDGLQSLNVSNNPGAPFVFARPRLEPTGTSPGPGVVEVKLVVDEPLLPTTMTASLSVDNGTLSVTEAIIPERSTESAVFTVTQDAGAPMTLRASTGVLTDYVGVETAPSELVLDVVGPSVSGVEIVSIPASGDAYRAAAGEVIRVAVGFDEAVEASTTTAGPWLTLTIGKTTRVATYAPGLSDASTLIFTYALQAGDADADGVSIGEDALVLAGAVITDLSGNPIENTSLASHAVPDAAGHRVIRTFRLRFDPSEAVLAPGTSIVATLVLEGAEALASEEEVSVELTASSGLELLTTSPVTMNSGASSRVAVRLELLETAGPGNRLTASVPTSLPAAEFFPGVLEVVRGVELLLLDHAGQAVTMVTIVAGEATEITVATAPVLEGNERATVTLSVAEGLTLDGIDSELIEGNVLVLTSAAKSASTRVRVGTSTPDLDLSVGVSASGVGENVGVVGEAPSLGVATEVADEVAVALPSLPITVQQGSSNTMLHVGTDPLLGTGQAVTVRLTITPYDAGLSFADGSFITDVRLGETRQSVDVEVVASSEAVIGSSARVTSMVLGDPSVGLTVSTDIRSEAVLEVVLPRVVLGLRPAGGEIGEALTLGLGESKAVELSLTDFTLSGNQTATFEVSISGAGLSLQGGTPNRQVSLDAASNRTAEVTVSASDSADSTGELSVRALSGVELAGGAEVATLPIEVLQSVSLSFVPDLVEIQRGRSTEFEVRMSEPLVADRQTTVTLTISEEGFSFFDAGSTQHEVTFDADKSSETVMVAATAAIDSMVSVSVGAITSSGVALAPLPGLILKATTPRVSVAFSPAGELRLPSGGAASVTLSLADYSLAGNQEIVLGVSAEGEGLEVSSPSVTLTATSPTATVRVSASRRVESGNLVVSALRGAELVDGTQSLPVSVSPRQLAISFEPSMVRLVRGGAAAETASTEVRLSVAPALEGDEELVLELTSGDGELEVSPPARLSSMVRAVPVRVTASLTTASTEVATSVVDADTSIGNAVVSFTPLTVEVVRGAALSLSDHAGQAVTMVTIVAGESTEITVATSPTLERDERVTVTLSVAEGLSVAGSGLIGGNALVLTSAENSTSARVSVSTSTPGLDLAMGITASGEGENVGVVGEAPALGVATEFSGRVAVVLPSVPIEVPQGSRMTFRVETDPPLDEGQAVTLRLTIAPADAGLSFAGGSLFTDVSLGETRQSVDVEVFASPEAEIGSGARVTSMVVNASVGLRVTPDEATLEVTAPQVTLGLTPAGGEIGDALSLGLGEREAVALSLTDFTPSGSQEAVFEVSVEGEGLTLEGGAKSIQVSFVARENTKPISVTASDDAASVGRLVVRPVGGVELAGDAETTSLPIGVLQSVSLSFVPDSVVIQPGRSAQFEVVITPSLVADRMVKVTLTISDPGFAFDTGSTQHEVTFDAGKSRETVTVTATAAEGSMVQVSVVVDATQGVDLAPPPSLPPSLNLQATLGTTLRIRVFLEGALE